MECRSIIRSDSSDRVRSGNFSMLCQLHGYNDGLVFNQGFILFLMLRLSPLSVQIVENIVNKLSQTCRIDSLEPA